MHGAIRNYKYVWDVSATSIHENFVHVVASDLGVEDQWCVP